MGGSESKPWRNISLLPDPNAWTIAVEKQLRVTCLGSSNKMKILMFGPTQSGKSSLVNSLLCAMNGKIGQHALAGLSEKSFTRTLYSPNARVNGQPLSFTLTDMPGFFREKEDDNAKHSEDYLKAVLEGHIKEDMVVPEGPLDKTADYYVETPKEEDLPCCVVLAIRAGKPLDEFIKKKFQLALYAAQTVRLRVAVVLTHVDNMEGERGQNLRGKYVANMFHDEEVHKAVRQASNETGIPLSYIYPVVNYSHEQETITEMNILLLYTLSKILHLAEEGANARHR